MSSSKKEKSSKDAKSSKDKTKKEKTKKSKSTESLIPESAPPPISQSDSSSSLLPTNNIGLVPTEVISGRVLTHFDETAGVAISRNEVEQHIRMGNVVYPLTEAYKSRYDRLRALLTGKLLPKREHLLQLRRQLQHRSADVDAERKGIERETLTDTEQILERIRAVESMRQSSIKHNIIQLEEELQGIERIVRRVERANIEDLPTNPASTTNINTTNNPNNPYAMASVSTGVLLTSVNPSAAPVETIRVPRATAMVEVIHEFADLCSNIERLATKSVTVQVDFPTDDFPRETAERLEVISRCDRYTHALQVKDHMLWTALQEKDRLEQDLQAERNLTQEYVSEVAQWVDTAQQLTRKLNIMKQQSDKKDHRIAQLLSLLNKHHIHVDPDYNDNNNDDC